MPAVEVREQRDQPTVVDQPLVNSLLVVPPLPQQQLAVRLIQEDFEAAKRSREERDYGFDAKGAKLTFDTWLKELTDLYYGHRQPKSVPWRFCSNRSLMIAMAILEVLHARIFPAVYNEDLTRWRPTEVNDVERAERVEKLMYWWVRVRSSLREFFDRWVRITIGFGESLVVSRWDVQLIDKGERTQPPLVPGLEPMQPEKVLERLERSRSDIIPRQDVFLQPGATDIQRDTVIIRRKYLYRDLEELERNGIALNVSTPSIEGGKSLKELLPVPEVVAEGATPEQTAALADVRRRNKEVECYEWYGGIDIDGDGFPEQLRLLVCLQHQVYLSGVAIADLSERGIRHLDFTGLVPRIDNPMGLEFMGVLEQVKELALEIDAIFNQMTDANSLSVMRPFFYDPSGDLDAPALILAPNRGTPVPNPSQNVYFPEINIPTERLINAVTMVMEFIERLTAASAYVMGKESEIVGGSGTATRTQAIVGAAGQRHAIPIDRLRAGAARILTHHLDLVQKNLPPGLETRIFGEKGELLFDTDNPLTRESIAGEFDAYLLPDESLGSKETERQLANLLYSVALGNPIIMSDMSKLYKVTADLYKAYGKDPEQYLGIAPDVKQTDRPEDENMLILQGNFASVKASILDNPIEHVLKHQLLPQSPAFQMLDPASQQLVLQFLQGHIQEHVQMMQMMMQVAQKAGKQGGGQNGPQRGGAAAGRPSATQAVGPEPRVGAPEQPSAAVGAAQRIGEGSTPA